MTKPIIEVKNLSKKYRIAHERKPYHTLREDLIEMAKTPARVLRGHRPSKEDFWALKDVSFAVEEGEVLGIIGKNGAGKSTLLKILSGITSPTSGQAILRGRVASLLEVGTGFHPELTGRENIFLNGTLLGMNRQEVKRKFDEIASFSEVEKFLDTPVKHYSSGMYVRLAFAVAAHLEPEVFIVDEVLAVGDAGFQKKCVRKMTEIAKEGRTILFVSHNLTIVKALCDRALLLSEGEVVKEGRVDSVLEQYFKDTESKAKEEVIKSTCGRFVLPFPYWIDDKGERVNTYEFGDNYRLRFKFKFLEKMEKMTVGTAVVNSAGQRVFTSHSNDDDSFQIKKSLEGDIVIDTELNLPELSPGIYQVIFGVRDEKGENVIHSEDGLSLEIKESGVIKDGAEGVLWHTGRWFLVEQE